MMSIHTIAQSGREVPARLLIQIGVGLGAFGLQFLFTHPLAPLWWHIEFLTITGIAAAIVYCGYWLAQSDYESQDLWAILGWCLGGLASGLLLAGGIYIHQTIEQVSIADLPFLFEALALIGAGIGVLFGLVRHAGSTRQLDPVMETATSDDTDMLWDVLSQLGGDLDALRQR